MKYFIFNTAFVLFAAASAISAAPEARASSSCGQEVAVAFDDGNPLPGAHANYQTFNIRISLNGRSAFFNEVIYPASLEGSISSDNCGFNGPTSPASRDLFYYAQYGNALNAWDVTVELQGQAPQRYRLPPVELSKLNWR